METADGGTRRNPQIAIRLTSQSHDFDFGGVEFGDDVPAVLVKTVSRRSQVQGPCRSVEQPDADPPFQHTHLFADRRLGHAKLPSRGGETLGLDDLRECDDVRENMELEVYQHAPSHSSSEFRRRFIVRLQLAEASHPSHSATTI